MTEQISLMEMLRRVQQGMPVEGSYLYKRFDQDEPVHVTIENIDGEMLVRFFVASYPVGLRNIPIDATFELIK